MGNHIAVVSPEGPELTAIRAILKEAGHPVSSYTSAEMAGAGLKTSAADLLILRLERFEEKNLGLVDKVRRYFPNMPVIIVANLISHTAAFSFRRTPGAALLSTLCELRDLPAIVSKLLRHEAAGLRAHPRAQRAEQVQLIEQQSGQILKGEFLDFAKMGARLKIFASGLRPATKVQLLYDSSKQAVQYRIESVVVWQASRGGFLGSLNPSQIVGLKFIAYA